MEAREDFDNLVFVRRLQKGGEKPFLLEKTLGDPFVDRKEGGIIVGRGGDPEEDMDGLIVGGIIFGSHEAPREDDRKAPRLHASNMRDRNPPPHGCRTRPFAKEEILPEFGKIADDASPIEETSDLFDHLFLEATPLFFRILFRVDRVPPTRLKVKENMLG